jgi:hypothetical protein
MPVLIFQPTVNLRARDIESERVRTVIAGKKTQLWEVATYIYIIGVWERFRG